MRLPRFRIRRSGEKGHPRGPRPGHRAEHGCRRSLTRGGHGRRFRAGSPRPSTGTASMAHSTRTLVLVAVAALLLWTLLGGVGLLVGRSGNGSAWPWLAGVWLLGIVIGGLGLVRMHRTCLEAAELDAARQELQLSHERLHLVLEGAELGLWDWNAETGEVVFNERWAEMLGLSLADLEPSIDEWKQRVHPDDLEPTLAAVQAHLDGETGVYESLHRLRHRDGSWRWVLDRGRVVQRTDDGRPLRVTGTHLDMTERQTIEETRRDLERQSLEMRRMQGLGILTGGIAHDFNNLLQVIRGNAELVGQTTTEAPSRRQLGAIIDAAEDAAHLCDQMLVYAGQSLFRSETCDLAVVVAAAVRAMEVTCGETEIAMEIDGAAEVQGDAAQLQRALETVITNACEASEGGDRASVRVVLDRRDLTEALVLDQGGVRLEPGAYHRLRVVDTGHGMSAETLARATDPFYSTRFPGRGLGLAVALRIVQRHGGGLLIDSREQAGTTVTALLPIRSGDCFFSS
ncbi:PAS domain-containing protein [bacterium]|nr:PAS domain-containing protein [bacterium]